MTAELRINGPPLTESQIDEIVQEFNFARVANTMVATNWVWARHGRPPIYAELVEAAREHLRHLGPDCNYIESGGLRVHREDGGVELAFILDSSVLYCDDDDQPEPTPPPTRSGRKLELT